MRSASWIEFLITFGIFIFIIIYLFQQINIYRTNYLSSMNSIIYFQEGFLISFLSNYNINVSNYVLDDKYYSLYYIIKNPVLIFLYNNNYTCRLNGYGSICLYYNSSGEKLEIKQVTFSKNLGSSITILLYEDNNDLLFNNTFNNVTLLCVPIYKSTYIYERALYECVISLYGNSTVVFYPVNDIKISNYNSILNLYYDNQQIYNPLSAEKTSFYTYYSFSYDNGILYYDYINIE